MRVFFPLICVALLACKSEPAPGAQPSVGTPRMDPHPECASPLHVSKDPLPAPSSNVLVDGGSIDLALGQDGGSPAIFERLTRVSALGGKGSGGEVGKVRQVEILDPRRLVTALISGGVIRTVLHDESFVCIDPAMPVPGGARVSLRGYHVYYTQFRNEAAFSADVVIHSDGRIEVIGKT